jgi:hypothetical protein
MSAGRTARLLAVLAVLVAGGVWVHRTPIEPNRVNLWVGALIGAVTTVYALFTFEILLQNQSMAKAAVASVDLAERSLRFSYSSNLQYKTFNTKDPTFGSRDDIAPIDTEYYRKALAEPVGEQQQKEFVFAIIRNVGRGPATNLKVVAVYNVTDSSSAAKEYSLTRQADVQILEPARAVALCIFFSKVPTRDDQVKLDSAKMSTSDIYRDALGERPLEITVDRSSHHSESEAGCAVQLV